MRGVRALALVAVLLGAPPHGGVRAAEPEPIHLRFSMVARSDSANGKAAAHFKALAERETRGRVRVDIFFDSALYGARDELTALQLGAVEVVCAQLHSFSAIGLSDFDVFELPFLFDSYAAVRRVADGRPGATLLGSLRQKGIEGLEFWDVGFKQVTATRPLRSPRDAYHLAIRTTFSRVSDATWRSVGARPSPRSFRETREGLRSGELDGTEFTAFSVKANGIDDLQTHLTLTNHAYVGSALVVNRRFWDKLPDDIRRSLASAARDATRLNNDSVRQLEQDALAMLRTRGRIQVVELDAAERERWKRALLPVHHTSNVSASLLDTVRRAAGATHD